jgi:hypothetical protein
MSFLIADRRLALRNREDRRFSISRIRTSIHDRQNVPARCHEVGHIVAESRHMGPAQKRIDTREMSIHMHTKRASLMLGLQLLLAACLPGCETESSTASPELRRSNLVTRIARAKAQVLGADDCIAAFETCTDDPESCAAQLEECLSASEDTGEWPTDTGEWPDGEGDESDDSQEWPEDDEEDHTCEDTGDDEGSEDDFPGLDCGTPDWGASCDQAAQACWDQASTDEEFDACVDQATACYADYFCGDDSQALAQCREMFACWDAALGIEVPGSLDLDICALMIGDLCTWLEDQ